MLCAFPQGGIAHVGVEGLGSLFPGHGTYGGDISRGDCADDVVGKMEDRRTGWKKPLRPARLRHTLPGAP